MRKIPFFLVKACTETENSVGKSVLLNHSTDGFSGDNEWNLTTMINYLEGKRNQISFPDNNHNVKNGRYNMVGGHVLLSLDLFLIHG